MVTNMVDINPSISVIALNISGLNILKDKRLSDWIKSQDTLCTDSPLYMKIHID